MSLTAARHIGNSALTASQLAIQVAGNNMANAATVGFHRQSVHMAPMRGESVGRRVQAGQGVLLQTVRREIDTALQSRYRDSMSQHSGDLIDQRFLTSIETIQNELSDNDLSSLLSTFFSGFSELANNPEDGAVRNVVIHYRSGVELPPDRADDIDSRWVERILATDQQRHAKPLSEHREDDQKVGGCCRDYALLTVAALRRKGVPARTRVGFASYFFEGFHPDHVLAETWEFDGEAWQCVQACEPGG